MKKVLVIIVVLALAAGGFYVYKQMNTDPIDKMSVETILEDASDLTTQNLIVANVFEETKGSIPFINKKSYLVKYKASVSAGFDVSEAKVTESDSEITVLIPHCTVDEKSVNVRGKDIKTYDTNLAIFKPDENAMFELEERAEKEALEYAKSDESGLLEAADKNAKKIVKGLFVGVADGREIVVEFQ